MTRPPTLIPVPPDEQRGLTEEWAEKPAEDEPITEDLRPRLPRD